MEKKICIEFFVLFENGARISIVHSFEKLESLVRHIEYFEDVVLIVVCQMRFDWTLVGDRYRGKFKGPYIRVITG